MIQLSGMKQSEGIRIVTLDIRTQPMNAFERMIIMVLIRAANKKLPFSQTLSEETKHYRVSFSI